MKVVGNKRPRVAGRGGFFQDAAKSIQEIVAVIIISEDFSAFDAPHDDVMQGARERLCGIGAACIKA